MGFCMPKIWQILKRFAGTFYEAWTSYFWRVSAVCLHVYFSFVYYDLFDSAVCLHIYSQIFGLDWFDEFFFSIKAETEINYIFPLFTLEDVKDGGIVITWCSGIKVPLNLRSRLLILDLGKFGFL